MFISNIIRAAIILLVTSCASSASMVLPAVATDEEWEAVLDSIPESLSVVDANYFKAGLLPMAVDKFPLFDSSTSEVEKILMAPAALKSSRETLAGVSVASIVERGRAVASAQYEASKSEIRAKVKLEHNFKCMRQYVDLSNVELAKKGEGYWEFNLEISNNIGWALSRVLVRVHVYSEGRDVPWALERSTVNIAGGLEDGESVVLPVTFYGITPRVPDDAKYKVTLSDIGDSSGRAFVSEDYTHGWGDGLNNRDCPL